MPWITLPTVFGASPWFIADLNADFAAIVNALNTFNPSGAPFAQTGVSTVRGLVGSNNSGSPTIMYDLSCDFVVLRDPATGSLFSQDTVVTTTNDTSLAGPIIDGRDQAGVFSAGSWVHFYWIGNPTAFAVNTISSAVPPPGGPTLPTGYTSWAYAGAVRFDGGSLLVPTRMAGASMSYVTAVNVVFTNATVINTETPVSLAAVIPPNALSAILTQSIVVANLADSELTLTTRVVTGANYAEVLAFVSSATAASSLQAQLTIPNVGQQYAYLWNLSAPSTPALTITVQDINGYRVPNGDS